MEHSRQLAQMLQKDPFMLNVYCAVKPEQKNTVGICGGSD
jgi:hypothetical protein